MIWVSRAALAIAVAQFAAFWQPSAHAVTPSSVLTIAALALAAAFIAALAQAGRPATAVTAGPLLRRGIALRRKSWGAAFQRQRDPDSAGRARPRAPSAAQAAA